MSHRRCAGEDGRECAERASRGLAGLTRQRRAGQSCAGCLDNRRAGRHRSRHADQHRKRHGGQHRGRHGPPHAAEACQRRAGCRRLPRQGAFGQRRARRVGIRAETTGCLGRSWHVPPGWIMAPPDHPAALSRFLTKRLGEVNPEHFSSTLKPPSARGRGAECPAFAQAMRTPCLGRAGLPRPVAAWFELFQGGACGRCRRGASPPPSAPPGIFETGKHGGVAQSGRAVA